MDSSKEWRPKVAVPFSPDGEERGAKRSLPDFLLNYSITSKDFYRILKSSKSLVAGDLLFRYHRFSPPKLGMIVSRAYGKAVQRNKFKRRCRYLFQQYCSAENHYSLIIKPLSRNLSYMKIHQAFQQFYLKIND